MNMDFDRLSHSPPENYFTEKPRSFEIAPGRWVGDDYPCFIIAEIGQNHQGDLQIAKKLIECAKECGADCVKFQKSDLKSRFTSMVLNEPYDSCNSFGKTYGEHRKKLEFTDDQFLELNQFATAMGIYFTATGMDKPSIDFLYSLNIPFFKIGSGDCTNLPLLRHIAKYKKPLIISTGMSCYDNVHKIYYDLFEKAEGIAILQCTSSYPVDEKEVNLNVIKVYRKQFPGAVIGYSGHELGIGISIAAVAIGAKILERHITLDHTLKGSDHKASLEPSEFKQLVIEVRRVEQAIGSYEKRMQKSEEGCYRKLGKTVVATEFLPSGTVITEDMIDVKVGRLSSCYGSDKKGWDPINYDDLIGSIALENILPEQVILPEQIKQRTLSP